MFGAARNKISVIGRQTGMQDGKGPSKRIVHVEFDNVLLTTRHALLETAGFEVVSCFGSAAARQVMTDQRGFDLFLIGHAASMQERDQLIAWAQSCCPRTPILTITSRDTDQPPKGVLNAGSGPEDLLRAIDKAFSEPALDEGSLAG